MKKTLLTLVVVATGFWVNSQVICAGVSPAAIQGNYNFTWADPAGGDWSCPNFLISGTFVQDTLAMMEDGTPGTNAEGNPLSQEGCMEVDLNLSDIRGKIAVCYRGTCQFGSKAMNAQDSGAVAIIIINRDPSPIGMAGGAEGSGVTIPVVMLGATDGAALVNQMLTDDVVMFIGNKTGLYDHDAGVSKNSTLISKSTGVPSQLAQNGSEFNFDFGTRVFNYGIQNQTGMTLNASVDGPSGNVYSETITLPTVLAGDSIDVEPSQPINFPQFSLASYPDGRYTVTYTLSGLDSTDAYSADNTVEADFVISDSIYALAHLDETTNTPIQTNGFRPSVNTSTFSNCIVLDNPNASRLQVDGLYFQAIGSSVDLTGEQIGMYVYQWQDVFTDLNDPALAFNNLILAGNGFYTYPSDLQGETVYGALDSPAELSDNQRYLMCAQTFNLDVFLGFDNTVNYLWNEDYYLQPLGPIENDGAYFASGFGMDIVPGIGAKVSDNTVGLEENGTIEGVAYPNPATEEVTISLETAAKGTLVVSDITGKVAMTLDVSFANENNRVDISELEPGLYLFNVELENGQTSQFNIVKK